MSNAISFKFSFETDDYDAIHNLMPLVFKKMKELQQTSPGYRVVEFNLLKPAPDKKTACLTIHHHDRVIREEAREEDWEAAIETVFGHVSNSAEHSFKLD